ncbi:MAG: HEAT repeat domain-containing protein [Armatimonadota bacterium]
MLSTLIALSSLTLTQVSGGQGESVFPKPVARNPEVLTDRSIFQYLTDSTNDISRTTSEEQDWSALKLVAPKVTAVKLRVLMLVFERDFTNPRISNTLELSDKTRLVQSMSRIRAFFSSMSAGELDIEVIPRFISEPIFFDYEAKEILEKEFNQSKFDADDREERGPFDSVIAISSSNGKIGFSSDFSSLSGNSDTVLLEQNLVRTVCWSFRDNLLRRYKEAPVSMEVAARTSPFNYPNQWPSLRKSVDSRLFSKTFRSDNESVLRGTSAFGAQSEFQSNEPTTSVSGSVNVLSVDGALVYTESAIIRNGRVKIPGWPVGILEFKVRTKSSNPVSFRYVSPTAGAEGGPEVKDVTIGVGASIPITPDGTWQTVRVGRADGKSQHLTFGVPAEFNGVTRDPHEVVKYEFKEFKIVSDAPNPVTPPKTWNLDTSEGIAQALTSARTEIKRNALAQVLSDPDKFKSLQPKLLEMSTELEPAVAFGAVHAYGRIGIANDDLIGKAFMNRLVATAPNEYAREAALLYFAEHPEQTTFEAIAPNIVRRSWRTRIATVKALAALDRTELKAKPAARQLLLTATGQDMAIIRSAALAMMKPEVELERKQLEYSLVNDPSEQVRLQCLKQLAAANASKEVLFGSLADDSPYVREHVYEQLPVSLQREALQRMVIDRDTYVRAAALYGFAKLSESTQSGEIQNTFAEEHPAVLLALVEGAQRGKWKLPANVIENAKKSKSPLVREGAAKLALQ